MATKVLNLYAGIGGNRKLWEGVEVTAVEWNEEIAKAYQGFYPADTVVVEDAHEYLLKNYMNFDFIWSSPPCPTHGQYRYNVGVKAKGYEAVYPDMQIYEEVLLLQYHCEGRWVVENVKPYYEPLVKPTAILQRHLFWANYAIDEGRKFAPKMVRSKNKISDYADLGYDITDTKINNKRQVLRNCVDAELGLYIFEQASVATGQTKLFE